MNLIMCVPLRDQSGKVRYYLGAQLDITDLVNDCTGLLSLKKLIQRQTENQGLLNSSDVPPESLQEDDEFEQLSQTFNPQELEQLLALRKRQHLKSEEKVIAKDSANQQSMDDSFSMPLAGLDNGFQINGRGSTPPLGYYKTVSACCGMYLAIIFTNPRSIFSSDLIPLFAFSLPRLICRPPESSNPPL